MIPTATFILSQIIGTLCRVDVVLALLCALTLLAAVRGKHKWTRRYGVSTASLVAALTILPVGNLMILPLERAFPVSPDPGSVEGIIVLGGGETNGTFLGDAALQVNASGDRFLSGLRLAHAYPTAWVLFSGGRVTLTPSVDQEINLGGRILQEVGLDPARLLVERSSRNTAENARLGRAVVPAELSGNWVLVTSAFHMRRAVAAFCGAGWSKLVPWPTDHRARQKWAGLSGNIDLVNISIHEWIGWAAYRMTGTVQPPGEQTCVASVARQ